MTPVLYDKNSSGVTLGVLQECISCTVTEELNGIFECTFQYPVTGDYFQLLTGLDCMVSAAFEHYGGGYLTTYFDVYKFSAPINGIVTFYAQHVSYRMSNLIVKGGFTANDPYDALAKIFANAQTTNLFSFEDYSPWNGNAAAMTVPEGYYSARELMLGRGEGVVSIINTWDCEFEFLNFSVRVYPQRGLNRGFQIRYGKNINNVTREKDVGGVVGEVWPYWHDSDNTAFVYGNPATSPKLETGYSPWTTKKISADIPPIYYQEQIKGNGETIYFQPALINPSAIDFSDQFETAPSAAQLTNAALKYMSKNSTWRANDNITVDFVDLYGTPEYEDIKNLEFCVLGDYVSIYYPELGIISKNVEIVSVTFDTLAERFTTMQLGTIKTTLAQLIINTIGGSYK